MVYGELSTGDPISRTEKDHACKIASGEVAVRPDSLLIGIHEHDRSAGSVANDIGDIAQAKGVADSRAMPVSVSNGIRNMDIATG